METTTAFDRRAYLQRGLRIILTAMVISAAVTVVAESLPVDLRPHLAVSIVLGLVFGPFACLGVNIVSLITNVINDVPPEFCALDLVTVFTIAYFPYRMWYSTSLGCDTSSPPSLTTVRDVAKFMAIMVASSVVYTVLYNLTYGMLYGTFELAYDDLVILMSVISFSIIFGMGLIVIFRYMGIAFYVPHDHFKKHDSRDSVPGWAFDLTLFVAVVLAPAILVTYPQSAILYPLTAVTYALMFIVLLKPITAMAADDSRQHIGKYTFNGSLIERIIVIFVVIGLGFSLISGYAAYNGVLSDLFDHGRRLSTVFYMGATSLAFFMIALLFLKYVETRISNPLGGISEAARNFVDGSHQTMSSKETLEEYGRYTDYASEIGVLARSLTDMTRDIEAYTEDIRNLNNREQMYLAEMSVAATIQTSLIPRDFDRVSGKGVNLHGAMIPAKYVGGDLYDFFMIDDSHLAVVVADVSGKGVPAAMFMAVTKALLEECARPGSGPEEVLSRVNTDICRNNDESMFVTCWFGIIDTVTGRMEFCNAGHGAPLVVRTEGEVEFLRTRPCMALGGMDGVKYRRETTELHPGDRLVLYTDGVTEANSDYHGFYGEGRLAEKATADAGKSISEEVSSIVEDVIAFTGDAEQFDDVTLFIVEYIGQGSSRS